MSHHTDISHFKIYKDNSICKYLYKYFLEICDEFWAWGNEWRFTKNEEFNENHPNRGCLSKPKFGDGTIGDNLLLIKYGSYLKYICQRYVKRL